LVWLALTRSRVEIVDDGFAGQFSSVSTGRIFPPPGRVAPAPAPVVSPGVVGTGLGRSPSPVSSSTSPVVGAGGPSAPVVGTGAPASPAASSISSSISSSMPATGGGPAHVHARGGGVSPLGDGEINTNLPSVHLSPRHGISSLLGVLGVLEIDEGEAPAATSVAVQDHLNLGQRPVLLELGLQLSLAGVETQTEDSETLAGLGSVSRPLVTSPVGHRRPGVVTAVFAVPGPGPGATARS